MPSAAPKSLPRGARYGWARRLYGGQQWQKMSRRFLEQHPTCEHCGGASQHTDHITPPLDPMEFWAGPFQALCASCHCRKTQFLDKRRDRPHDYHTGADLTGWPKDGRHPWVTGEYD